jgi:hypothetical protein
MKCVYFTHFIDFCNLKYNFTDNSFNFLINTYFSCVITKNILIKEYTTTCMLQRDLSSFTRNKRFEFRTHTSKVMVKIREQCRFFRGRVRNECARQLLIRFPISVIEIFIFKNILELCTNKIHDLH